MCIIARWTSFLKTLYQTKQWLNMVQGISNRTQGPTANVISTSTVYSELIFTFYTSRHTCSKNTRYLFFKGGLVNHGFILLFPVLAAPLLHVFTFGRSHCMSAIKCAGFTDLPQTICSSSSIRVKKKKTVLEIASLCSYSIRCQ